MTLYLCTEIDLSPYSLLLTPHPSQSVLHISYHISENHHLIILHSFKEIYTCQKT
jgi:hypothetical protein